MIALNGIRKVYSMGKRELVALDEVDLSVEAGDFLALKGPSGSGKSTLLNIMGLVDTPTEGDYALEGKSLCGLNPKGRSEFRRNYLGFIFQNYNLIPELTVCENVEIPLIISRVPKVERKSRVDAMVEEVGLKDHARHKPGELSGGQQQRVAIARALVKRPPLIVADEPTANLDSRTGKEIIGLMKELNERHGITFVFATHDETIVSYMKTIVYMQDGKITGQERRS